MSAWFNRTALRRITVVVSLTALSIGGSWLLMPKTDYLPTGNSNFLIGILLPPPGYNVDEMKNMAEKVESRLSQYWEYEPGSPEALAQPGGGLGNFFFAAFGNQAFMGMRSVDDDRVRELLPTLRESLSSIPGTIGIGTDF